MERIYFQLYTFIYLHCKFFFTNLFKYTTYIQHQKNKLTKIFKTGLNHQQKQNKNIYKITELSEN